MAKYAVLATLEWTERKDDGSLITHRVEAGDVTDTIPEDSVEHLLSSHAIEAYDADTHKAEGWYQRRYNAELDKATVKAGGVPRAELDPTGDDRTITSADTAQGGDKR